MDRNGRTVIGEHCFHEGVVTLPNGTATKRRDRCQKLLLQRLCERHLERGRTRELKGQLKASQKRLKGADAGCRN